jgi:hypothetical protein
VRAFQPRRVGLILRALADTAGQAALRRGLPLYLGIFVAAVIVFTGPNAMRASELTGLAGRSLPFRLALLGVWLVLTLPVARTLLSSPAAWFLRTFALPWGEVVAALGPLLLAVELPWVVLWCAGAGMAAGICGGVIAAGGHALLVGRPRRWYERLAAGGWLVALALGPGLPFLLGAPALVLAARRAWLDAAEPRAPAPYRRARAAGRRARSRAPARALAGAYRAAIWRGGRPFVLRWLWFGVMGVGMAALAIRNNGVVAPGRMAAVSLAALAPTGLAGALGMAGAILRGERQALWWLEAQGVFASRRALAAALALVPFGLALGLIHGLAVARLTGAPLGAAVTLRLMAGGAAGGGVAAALAARLRGWADRGAGQDGGRLLRGALIIAAVSIAAVSLFAEAGLLLWLALGALIPAAPGAGIAARARPPATAAPEDA